MAAKIIAVVNQKGGSGKTTVSMQLAGALARRKNKVLVVDADPQGTATRWAASALDETPFPASVVGLSAASTKDDFVSFTPGMRSSARMAKSA